MSGRQDIWTTHRLVAALKAAAEPTRLRILNLLEGADLNVKDLTHILGQSQPRVSRHLKLLVEAGLIERFREGSWAFFHLSERMDGGRLARGLTASVDGDDPVFRKDRSRAEALAAERRDAAQAYFDANAAEWDRIRSLHVPEAEVEAAIRAAFGAGPFRLFLDLGTGTGRVLELMNDRYEQGLGIDLNQAMLAYARGKLRAAGVAHARVRHGDLYDLPSPDGAADAVAMHQVLHFLAQPANAIREAARVLAPGGRLMIVDFAPHELEFLGTDHAHERFGFPTGLVRQWLMDAGLMAVETRDLRPAESAAGGQLTVTVWSARREPAGARKQKALEKAR